MKTKEKSHALHWKGKGRNEYLVGQAVVKVQVPVRPNWEQGGEWLIYDESGVYQATVPHDEMPSIVLDNFRNMKTHRFNGKLKVYWQASFNGGRITFDHKVKDEQW